MPLEERPTIALTMGDPAGVGPEICLKAMADAGINAECRLVIFGDADILHHCAQITGQAMPKNVVSSIEELASLQSGVVDLNGFAFNDLQIGKVSAASGRASFEYIEAAIAAALNGTVAAVATAPINKEALRAAGLYYPGHTEIFAERARSNRWCMMQFSPEITCTFVTVHIGYAEVPRVLTTSRILETIELTHEGLSVIHGRNPSLIVCGLNPHAGEHGLFGDKEEERIIIPAIEQAQAKGILVQGPFPPDTAFVPSMRRKTDGFICMYHDQGHIPVKALAFDSAVNTTLGLKVVRTSVDHGTAYDIAWQSKASCSSLFAAIRLAIRLVGLRQPKSVGH
jgi:4-phospho-D-threonate 3-dehydrogenase / 4-phospho-D-erythronate 3-dehydrogenase